MTTPELAAWVQAVGSLIAIVIAIVVPLKIDDLNKKRIEKEKKTRSMTLALSILPDLYKLRASTTHYIEENEIQDNGPHVSEIEKSEAPREIDALHGDYFAHAENFKIILTAMPDLDVYGPTLTDLVYQLFKANEMSAAITRLQAGGHHAAFLNNRDEFVLFAQTIDTATAKLIEEIEKSHEMVSS